MNALRTTISADRALKRICASAAPSGRPTRQASDTAERLTRSDSRTMSDKAVSQPHTRRQASPKALPKSCITRSFFRLTENKANGANEQVALGCKAKLHATVVLDVTRAHRAE